MNNIQSFVEGLTLDSDITKRYDCPACGGANTFSVTKTAEGTKWFCFSASCGVKGIVNGTMSVSDMITMLSRDPKTGDTKAVVLSPYTIPAWWIPAERSAITKKYLMANGALRSYLDGRCEAYFDPRRQRHVFVLWNDGKRVGGIGRSMSYSITPKWYNYVAQLPHPFIVPQYGTAGSPQYPFKKKIGVVVEDCASAAAATCVADGVALIGTNLKDEYIKTLSTYDHLIIALDSDASKKAISICRDLSNFVDRINIVLLKDDLKYLPVVDIKELLERYTNG
jgi:hypothetical protein